MLVSTKLIVLAFAVPACAYQNHVEDLTGVIFEDSASAVSNVCAAEIVAGTAIGAVVVGVDGAAVGAATGAVAGAAGGTIGGGVSGAIQHGAAGAVSDAATDGVTDALVGGIAGGVAGGAVGAAIGGTGGFLVSASACAVEATVATAFTFGAGVLGIGVGVGLDMWDFKDWALSSRGTPPPMKASRALLTSMKFEVGQMSEAFNQMHNTLRDLTVHIQAERWCEVAATANLAISYGTKFKTAVHVAFKQAQCEDPPEQTNCPRHYYIDPPRTCWEQPTDCYDACCREQLNYCNEDMQCQSDRGCGPGVTQAPSFHETQCEDLQSSLSDFEVASAQIKSLESCACELEGNLVFVKGCSKDFEKSLRDQVKSSFKQVEDDLATLRALDEAALPDTEILLNLLETDGASTGRVGAVKRHWERAYVQVRSSCQNLQQQVIDLPLCTSAPLVLNPVISYIPNWGWCSLAFLAVAGFLQTSWLRTQAFAALAHVQATPLLPDHIETGRSDERTESRSTKQSIWLLILLLTYTLIVAKFTLSFTLPVATHGDEKCEAHLEHAQKMYDICSDFMAALSSCNPYGDNCKVFGIKTILDEIVAATATISKTFAPK